MNTCSNDDGDVVMLDEHHDFKSLLISVAEADGDTSMFGVDVLDVLDTSMGTSSVSEGGDDVLMPDVDEEGMMLVTEAMATDDLVVPMPLSSTFIVPPSDDVSMATSSESDKGDALMLDVDLEAMATDDLVLPMPLSPTCIVPPSDDVSMATSSVSDGGDSGAVNPLPVALSSSPGSISDLLVRTKKRGYDSISDDGLNDCRSEDLQPLSKRKRVEFDSDDLRNLGSKNEVGEFPSPGSLGDQEEFDLDSSSSFGSDDDVDEWEVEPAPFNSVDCPVFSLVMTLSTIPVEEESDEVQDEDESQGFEPSSLDDDLSDATTAAPEKTKRTVPRLEFRHSARLAAKSGNKVILPVGTLGFVFVNGNRRSARLSLF